MKKVFFLFSAIALVVIRITKKQVKQGETIFDYQPRFRSTHPSQVGVKTPDFNAWCEEFGVSTRVAPKPVRNIHTKSFDYIKHPPQFNIQ